MNEIERIKGFFFRRQYYETFRMLPDADRLALLAYAFEGVEPDESCPVLIRVALNGMKTTIDGSIRMHQARSEAGKRGGAPKGNRNACKDETSKNKQIQTETSEKEKEIEIEIEKEKETDKEINITADEPAGVYKNNSYSAEFEQFYKAYPRHTNKQDAFKAYCKVIKKVSPDTLLEALEKQKYGEWQKTEDRFIPYPATWLNRGGWENESSALSGRKYSYDYEEYSL